MILFQLKNELELCGEARMEDYLNTQQKVTTESLSVGQQNLTM